MHTLINENNDSYESYVANKQRIDRKCPYCKNEGSSGSIRVFDGKVYKVYECPCMKNNMGEYIFWTPKETMTREEFYNTLKK